MLASVGGDRCVEVTCWQVVVGVGVGCGEICMLAGKCGGGGGA